MQTKNKNNAIQNISLGIQKKIMAQSEYYFCRSTVILLEIQLNKIPTETCYKLAEQFVGGAILSYPFTRDEENKSFMKNDTHSSFCTKLIHQQIYRLSLENVNMIITC